MKSMQHESNCIRVEGIPETRNLNECRKAFDLCGNVKDIRFDGNSIMTVEYYDSRSSTKALHQIDGAVISGFHVKVTKGGSMTSSNGKSSQTICSAFQNGACVFGKTCPLLHTTSNNNNNNTPSKKENKRTSKSITLCQNLQSGNCKYGDLCRYSHDIGTYAGVTQITKKPKTTLKTKEKAPFTTKKTQPRKDAKLHSNQVKSEKQSKPLKAQSIANVGDDAKKALKKDSKKESMKVNDSKTKAKICRNMLAGTCAFGDKCLFSHDSSKKTNSNDIRATKVASTSKLLKTSAIKDKDVTPSITNSKQVMCAECTSAPGTLQCRECTEIFCMKCDQVAHSSRVMSKHIRTTLRTIRICAECSNENAQLKCGGCRAVLCLNCDAVIHKPKVLQKHKRVPLNHPIENNQPPPKWTNNQVSLHSLSKIDDLSSSSESEWENKKTFTQMEKKNDENATTTETNKIISYAYATSSESDSSSDEDNNQKEEPKMEQKTITSAYDNSTPKEQIMDSSSSSSSSSSSDSTDSTSSDSSSDDDQEGNHPPMTPKVQTNSATPNGASNHSKPSFGDATHSVVKKITSYAASSATEPLHLSASLNSYERMLAHETAEQCGLLHQSSGVGLERHISIAKANTTPFNSSKKMKSWSKTKARG